MITKNKKTALIGTLVLVSLSLPMATLAANKLVVMDAAGTTPEMVVTDTGYIGVGTSTPTGPIYVNSSNNPNFGAGVTNAIRIEGNDVTNGSGFAAYNNRATGVPPQANDRLGFIFFGSTYNNIINHPTGFFAKVDQAWTPTSTPAFFDFLTTPSGSLTRVIRMRISSAGNTGLGNGITATQRLEVEGGVRLNPVAPTPPTCDATTARGTLWFSNNGASKDSLLLCAFDGSTFGWRVIY